MPPRAYRIEYERRARRTLDSLPGLAAQRIVSAIDALAANPRPRGAVKVQDSSPTAYRLRVGDYRVIYEVRDRVLVVVVLRVGRRNERSYRNV